MKSFKETAKRMAYIFLFELIFMGIVAVVVDKLIISFIKTWPLWQIIALVVSVLAVSAAIYFLHVKIKKFAAARKFKAAGKKVQSILYTAILEFLSLRLQDVKLDKNPENLADACDMLLNEYNACCKVGAHFNRYVKGSLADYNNLLNCASEDASSVKVKVFELAALKDLQAFLDYLAGFGYGDFCAKYSQQISSLTSEILKGAEDDKAEIEYKSNRLNYLQRLCDEREANLDEYVPLSYKAEDDTLRRYSLSELDELENNREGFVLSADAGYGKSWSIVELAGRSAKKAQLDESETPILIKMGQVAENEQPILKTIGEILFPGESDLEKVRKFLQTQKVILYIDGMDEACFKNKEAARREMLSLRESCSQLRIIGGTRGADKDKFPKLSNYSIFDLSDEQVRAFMQKQITEPALYEKAEIDYFNNEETAFLRSLRSPFYLKCYVDFVLEGESAPISSTDVFQRCTRKMMEREIKLKGFAATTEMLDEFLFELAKILSEDRYKQTSQVLKSIKEEWVYEGEEYASLISIKDTLVELGILAEESGYHKGGAVLGFRHEEYKNLYSQTANDSSLLDY